MANRKSLDELEILSPKELGEMLLYQLKLSHTDIEYIKDFINAGANLEVKNQDGFTPLFYATYWGIIEAMKVLIEGGADLEVRNEYGFTPLHMAARCNFVEAAKVLIAAGASKEAITDNNQTPWDLATLPMQTTIPKLNPNYNG